MQVTLRRWHICLCQGHTMSWRMGSAGLVFGRGLMSTDADYSMRHTTSDTVRSALCCAVMACYEHLGSEEHWQAHFRLAGRWAAELRSSPASFQSVSLCLCVLCFKMVI